MSKAGASLLATGSQVPPPGGGNGVRHDPQRGLHRSQPRAVTPRPPPHICSAFITAFLLPSSKPRNQLTQEKETLRGTEGM